MKSTFVAYMLWFFGGFFGAHRYYLGQKTLGLAYTLTLGGGIIPALLDGLYLDREVTEYNEQAAYTGAEEKLPELDFALARAAL